MTNNRKKIWEGEINFPEHNFITTSHNCYINEIFMYKKEKLTWRYLKSLSEEERDEISKSVFNWCLEHDFSKFKDSKESIKKEWNKLCKSKIKSWTEENTNYLTNSSSTGSRIYKVYFPNIYKIKTNKSKSIFEALTNKETLWKIIRNRVGNTLLYKNKDELKYRQWPMDISLIQLIRGARASGEGSMGSIFKPAIAREIYEEYVKEDSVVYDYSMGFGTRLLGLMSLNLNNVKYIGVDPNTETFNNTKKLIKDFNFNAEIYCIGSEDFKPKEKIDFAFSSPPYWNKEIYTNEETQAYNKYKTYEDFIENYWRQTVKNIKSKLRGVFAINIGNFANKENEKLIDDFTRIIEEEGFKLIDFWILRSATSHLASKKKTGKISKDEPVLFYSV
jgi:hypothetical protein